MNAGTTTETRIFRVENLTKIFDPGFTTKGVGVGTGLGLSILYKIVKKHDGTIDCESVQGQGTTFAIRIPIPASRSIAIKEGRRGCDKRPK